MPPKSNQELREWYAKFSQELYDKVELDVTRKEDLGRVRVFKSDQWSVDNLTPDMQVTYAYMSHDGTKYADPEPALGQFQVYASWMNRNLNPQVTDGQIQKLYEQSCAGELMVYKPGGTLADIQMVLTDAQGNIKLSVPGNDYNKEDLKLPEDVYPKPPKKIVNEPNPADFGCPVRPVPPKNMEPSWLDKVLDFFGIHTAYTDLMDFQKASEEYGKQMEAWRTNPNGLAKFNQAIEDRMAYVQQAEAYLANPYSKHYAAFMHNSNRFVTYADQEGEVDRQTKHVLDEQDFLKRRHDGTPLGKMKVELSQIKGQLSHAKDTEVTLYNVIGHDPHPELMPNHEAYKNYHPESYNLPIPELEAPNPEQEQALEESWKDLAAIAGFNAISDYDILYTGERKGFTHDEDAILNYAMVFSNLFTENRSNVNHELRFIDPARQKAREAIEAYGRNEPEQLGKVLAHGLRHNMKEAACLFELGHRNTWGFLYLLNKTVETMDKHEGIWEATGLSQEEMDTARGYSELYKVLTRGHEARQELLEHASGEKTLSQGELEQAGQDALFASYVLCSVAASHQEQTAKLNSPERDEIVLRIGKIPAHLALQTKATKLQAAAKSANDQALVTQSDADKEKAKDLDEQAAAIQELADLVKQEKDITNGKMALFELKRESAPILKDLIKPDWVEAVKDQLAQHTNLPEVITSNKSIVDMFASASDLGKTTKNVLSNINAEQMEKLIEPELVMQNNEHQISQPGV